jgi:Uma2 family endonuclease
MVNSSESRPSIRLGGATVCDGVVYPDSDGQPISDTTKQFKWIVLIAENLDATLTCFVAGDLLWYPVKGHPEIRIGPDVLVAQGRPKGDRGSYIQSREDDVAPTVVFEVLSPSNSMREMSRKAAFYQAYGAKELIIIDPDAESGWAFVRNDANAFQLIDDLVGWTSPALGIRFERDGDELVVLHPDGSRFLSFGELQARTDDAIARADEERARADDAIARADEERARAGEERARADDAIARADRLAAKLAALGVSPDD